MQYWINKKNNNILGINSCALVDHSYLFIYLFCFFYFFELK